MSDLELTLDTDATRFEQWLDRYDTSRIYALDNGIQLSIHGVPTIRGEYKGLIKHEIRANYLEPNPDKPDSPIISFEEEFSVIEIELSEPAKDRLKVKLILLHSAVFDLYNNLVTGICQNWPEAIPQVELFAGKKVVPAIEKKPDDKLNPPGNKKESTIKRHKEAWGVIKELDEIYIKEYQELNTEKPKPEIEDYIEALIDKMGYKIGERMIRNIIKWGEEGLFE